MRFIEAARTELAARPPLATASRRATTTNTDSAFQRHVLYQSKSRGLQHVRALTAHRFLTGRPLPLAESTFCHHQFLSSDFLKLARKTARVFSQQASKGKESAPKQDKEADQRHAKKPFRLILLRHAKSSWDDPSLEDHERPLNKRGRKAAPDVASQIRSSGWEPELILSSDSTRTQETLHRMSKEWGKLSKVPTEFLHSLYEVAATEDGPTDTAHHLERVVVERAGSARCVMLVGHNMGWEQAASHYVGEYVQMKTAYAALLESHASSWEEAFRDRWELKAIVKPESAKS